MKKLYLIQLLLFISVVAYTQPYETNPDYKRANIWFFGDSVGIDLSQNPPYILSDGITKNENGGIVVESTGVICDKNGELLFYTDGLNVYNKYHSIMVGGENIGIPNTTTSSSQSNLILKHADNDSIYFIIITPYAYTHEFGMKFHIVNINKQNGTGEVVSKNNLLHDNSSEKAGAVFHSNGRDIWIVGHEWGNDCFFLYLLTKDGISKCPIYQCLGEPYRNLYTTPFGDMGLLGKTMNQGFIKFSPNGKYMSHIYTPNFSNLPSELFSFNNLTGELFLQKNLYWIDSFNSFFMWGNSFSSNSENLFLTEDLNEGIVVYNILLDSFKITSGLNLKRGTSFSLGIDGNIYVNKLEDTLIGVIKNANDFDSYILDTQYLNISPRNTGLGLPNIFNGYYYIPPINFTVKLNCVLNTVQFYGQDTFSATSHDWLITKQGSDSLSSNLKAPLIEFEDTGVFTVRYIASNGSRSDTIIKTVEILPKIEKDFLGNDTGWCNSIGTPVELKAPIEMHCYEWNTGETTPQITADTAGIYIAKITTPNFCVIYDTINISVDTVETIESDFLGEDKYWCENIDTAVTLSAPLKFDSYKWSNGSTDQHLITNEEGVYYVEAFKRNQCKSGGNFFVSDTVVITLLDAPTKPTLNREEDSLFINISNNYTYNWYRNNSLLSDTTEYLILPDTGYYFLKITNTNGCSDNSDTMHVATLGIENLVFSNMKIYPNPSTGIFTVEVLNGEYSFIVKDITGKSIKEDLLVIDTNQIDISHIADGIYFITINNNQNSITYKIIKQTE